VTPQGSIDVCGEDSCDGLSLAAALSKPSKQEPSDRGCIVHVIDAELKREAFDSLRDGGELRFTKGVRVDEALIREIRNACPKDEQDRPILRSANFSRADFTGEIDLSGVVFLNANFSSAEFSRVEIADLSGAVFSGGVDFSDARLKNANFSGADFSGEVDFSRADFATGKDKSTSFYAALIEPGCTLDLSNSTFSGAGSVSFDELTCYCRLSQAEEERVKILNETVCVPAGITIAHPSASPEDSSSSGTRSPEDSAEWSRLLFSGAQFNNTADVSFAGMHLHGIGEVDFTDSQFPTVSGVNFDGAEMLCRTGVRFRRARFSCSEGAEISFRETILRAISGDIDFAETRFEGAGLMQFRGSSLEAAGGSVDFTGTKIALLAGLDDFSGMTLVASHLVSFYWAQFSSKGGTSFAGSHFAAGDAVSFSRADFEGRGVTFVGATFYGGEGPIATLLVRESQELGDQKSIREYVEESCSRPGPTVFGLKLAESAQYVAFVGSVGFVSTIFQGPSGVDFSSAIFGGPGEVSFLGARFRGDPGGVSFESSCFRGASATSFAAATFVGPANFVGAYFEGSAVLRKAEFKNTLELGAPPPPETGREFKATLFKVKDHLVLDNAIFSGRISCDIRCPTVDAKGSRFVKGSMEGGGLIIVGNTESAVPSIDLSDADVVADILISAPTSKGESNLPPPRITSLSGTNCEGLTLRNVDLSTCVFTGALNLDRLSLARTRRFTSSPPSSGRTTICRHFRTRRQVLQDEIRAGPRFSEDTARTLEQLYRALRKRLEEEKNEAGASDFYYGEMAMRRRAAGKGTPDWWLLTLYSGCSGYGTRAWRAACSLGVVILVWAALLTCFGFQSKPVPPAQISTINPSSGKVAYVKYAPKPGFLTALTVTVESSVSILREPPQQYALTQPGNVLSYTVRILGPVLVALFVLSLRSRIRR
jgi:uncharacterized protein YjbI with pentapeptide repeats